VDIGPNVLKHEKRHRQTDHVEALFRDICEVAAGDIVVAVGFQARTLFTFAELEAEISLVFSGGVVIELGAHPLFQHEPVAEVNTSDFHERSPPYF